MNVSSCHQDKRLVNIRAISQFEFDALFPKRSLLESYSGRLVEWYANDRNDILGAIDHEITGTWSYVVMRKTRGGALHVVEINENLASLSDAKLVLYQQMEVAEETVQ
jgi:hypothetical protein